MHIYKGDIFYADLTPVVGCEQGGIRPVLIVQNNIGNRYSPTVIVAAITSRTGKQHLPTHIELGEPQNGLRQNSLVLLEQVRTIDRSRLRDYIGTLTDQQLRQVDEALAVSFGLELAEEPRAGSNRQYVKEDFRWTILRTLGFIVVSMPLKIFTVF